MREIELEGLSASEPLGFLAGLGTLRIVARDHPSATLRWVREAQWCPVLRFPDGIDPIDLIWQDVERWRDGHPAIDFARGADRKIQDLKHPPHEFRHLMRSVVRNVDGEPFVAAYATGVSVDSAGQTKPTSLHFTAGQQRFMDPVLTTLDAVTRADLEGALFGPWTPNPGKSLRWRSASERSRALLSYDPGKEDTMTVVGAEWLAFQSMPLLPVAPRVPRRLVTTGFVGRGKNEAFVWPVWDIPLDVVEVRVGLGLKGLEEMPPEERRARGIERVFRAEVMRSHQGYGNFSATRPV